MEGQDQRQGQIHLRVTDAEAETIRRNAAKCGLTVTRYLCLAGQGLSPKSYTELDTAIKQLSKISADLGRYGGLLRMWLVDFQGAGQFRGADYLGEVQSTKARMDAIISELESRVRRGQLLS